MKGKPLNIFDGSINPVKVMFILAWPTIIEQLLMSAVMYVDTAMVGSLGPDASAAVGLNASTTWLINGLCGALGVGFSVLVGRSIGAGDGERAKRVVRQAVVAMLVFGAAISILLFALSGYLPGWLGADEYLHADASAYLSVIAFVYLFNVPNAISGAIIRCAGDTRTPMVGNLIANVLNVAMNFLFIFPTRDVAIHITSPFSGAALIDVSFTMWGADMGVQGAALASVISMSVSALIMILTLYLKDYPARISIRDNYRLDAAIWKDTLRLAYPVALERIALSGGQIALTAMVTGLGTKVLAAHYLAITAESITYMPVFGFSTAATTLVAQCLGANNHELAKRYSRQCLYWGMGFMTAMGAVLYFAAAPLLAIMTPDAEVIELGAQVLRVEACAQTMFAASSIVAGVLRGAGDTKWSFYIGFIGMWGVRIGVAYLLSYVFELGLLGAWYAMFLDLTMRGILSLVRYYRGKWLYVWKDVHTKAEEAEAPTGG
ncbi:MAG: MATE family efflux transporter [Clostridia bacterium]|nr:MATE family efflux transporter [Clostridia bacterium]